MARPRTRSSSASARRTAGTRARSSGGSSPRSTWKGAIKLSLITIPIRVYPATNAAADVSFRQLHRKCHTPIQLKKWCPHCEEEVSADDVVKGYEASKGRFVIVEEEDIAKVRPDSTHVVDISHVVPASTIDPIYIERAYFMAPDSKQAGNSFAVLRDSFGEQAGVGRLALHGREYLVAVVPREDAMLMYTLRTKGEVRDLHAIDELQFADSRVKPEEVRLARQVLHSFERRADLSEFTDHYQEALKEMLAAKTAEPIPEAPPSAAKGTKVVNLMDALRQSLAHVSERKPAGTRPARAAAKVVRHPSAKKRRAS